MIDPRTQPKTLRIQQNEISLSSRNGSVVKQAPKVCITTQDHPEPVRVWMESSRSIRLKMECNSENGSRHCPG